MSSLLFVILWIIISIAFITTLVTAVVKYAKDRAYGSYLVSTIIMFFIGAICFACIFVSMAFNKDYSYSKLFNEDKGVQDKKIADTSKKDLKNLKIGDKIRVNELEVTVTKAEFVEPDDGYSYSQNGKILKVNYKFKNLNKEKALIDHTNFKVTTDGEAQPQFNGMKDNKGGFQYQLEKGQSESAYVYYDVADMNGYKVEMDYKPSKKPYKAVWDIPRKSINEDKQQTNENQMLPPQELQTSEQPTVAPPNNNDAEKKRQQEADKQAAADEKKRQQEQDKQAAADEKKRQQEADKKAAQEEKQQQQEADKKAAEEEKQRKQEEQANAKKEQEAEQKAAEQKAADQKAAEQKAAEQKAAEQKAAEQKAAEQKAEQQKQQQAAEDAKQQQQQQAKERAAQQAAQKAKEKSNSSSEER
ncbi:hypothetical protein [Mammaliicoccus sp. Dog046]|uniref:hypothetical protein n=1 Tax=Mammaliicoccus sp. Dog046 TaxID=3034233 RepID=UPI002B25C7B6|nr:hypothetical protein [Mammaliicoccus sp. Dog046]WQK84932.1 hypothetical protein P3U32_09890 [Mammaliicoccus sp. Dog046]